MIKVRKKVVVKTWTGIMWLVLSIVLLSPCLVFAALSYTWLDKGMYVAGEPVGYNLDFDDNGIIDLIYESTGMWFDVEPEGVNHIIAGGGDVHALPEGYSIGPDVASNLWSQGYMGLTLNSCAVLPPPWGTTCSGEFIEATAFMGVLFEIDSFIHYGWVRISNPYYGIPGGIIMDYAYETEPGVGILAGAGIIPEPSTLALMIVASVGLGFSTLCKKRRRRRASRL